MFSLSLSFDEVSKLLSVSSTSDECQLRVCVSSKGVKLKTGDAPTTMLTIKLNILNDDILGNARVIVPGTSACVECTLDLYPPQLNFPMCTLAHTPRLPEHCVEYVRVLLWPQVSKRQCVAFLRLILRNG